MKDNVASAEPKDLELELASTPGVAEVRAACDGTPTFLVGGAVRDLLTGRSRGELDIVTEGDVAELAERLGGADASHERFGTASLEVGGVRVDIARARTETYPAPGALPEVEPAAIEADLDRRDFTVNAMAIPLHEGARLIDPHGGLADLEAGVLRVLHPDSFADDPTRVLRAARYVARLGMDLEAETRRLAASADLSTVSEDRVSAELSRLAVEPNAERGFALLAELGLAGVGPDALARIAAVSGVLGTPAWRAVADTARSVLAAARGESVADAEALREAAIGSPSEGTALADSASPEAVVLARGLGAEWLDRWLSEWRSVRLEIGGEDLIAAGVEEGPAVGRGLAAALRAKLDGEVTGREAELEVALKAARAR